MTTVQDVSALPASRRDADLTRRLDALATACGPHSLEARAGLINVLNETLDAAREAALACASQDRSGLAAAQALSAGQDQVVGALFDFATDWLFPAKGSTAQERLCVCAVGGYGQGALAPYSDVDLLFLRPWKLTPWQESVIEFILYALWDLGLTVGHAVRSIDEGVRLAAQDWTICTALLDLRPICGDVELAQQLEERFARNVVRGREAAFVAAKLEERDQRLARDGRSRYAVEPNVKLAKGGLRDLQTLHWLQAFRARASDRPVEPVWTPEEAQAFAEAEDFLWRVRFWLHTVTERAEDRLTFDLQPELAMRMGYQDGHDGAPAVERFMRDYFLTAKAVGGLTRILCAALEAESAKPAPRGFARFWFSGDGETRKLAEPGYGVDGGRLTIFEPDFFERRPLELLNMFRVAADLDVDVHPRLLAKATRSLSLIDDTLQRDPEAARVFFDLLTRTETPDAVLRVMNEAGVLPAYLPEFALIVAKTQFNMYHRYTVDEHTLKALGVFGALTRGEVDPDQQWLADAMARITDRRALYLAMLLHDVGKSGDDQCEDGARLARQAALRLTMTEAEADEVAWLVRHHLAMSDVAQKRDIADPRTIADFIDWVGDEDRLHRLCVITAADIQAVGPGVWTGWKAQLLRDLYISAQAALRGDQVDGAPEAAERLSHQADAAREALIAKAPTPEGVADWTASLEDAYWLAFDEWDHARHRQFAETQPDAVDAACRLDPIRHATELIVAAPDAPGLFAKITAAIAGAGGHVVDARVFTSDAGCAFDVFYLHDPSGRPYGADDPDALRSVEAAVCAVVEGRADPLRSAPAPQVPRRAAVFQIEASVVFDDAASDTATVIEASGRARHGLLRDLARALDAVALDLVSAHLHQTAEQIVDVFYVRERDGSKVAASPTRRAEIETALLTALTAHAPAPPTAPNQTDLAQAPASAPR
ncbi:MAG: [protein-PII] uridylyltransferase [Maricaulaceae bacterium]